MTASVLLAVFLTGLLAGTHCAGMCGGVVTALSVSGAPGQRPPLTRLLAYNSGRIASYVTAGALVGALGAAGLLLAPVQEALYVVANLMLIALGLYLADLWRGVTYLERAGTHLWRHVAPLTRNFLPVRTPGQALALGALWGWLPCGLVYSMLVSALAAASATNGALIMLAFGLGTLPNLLALGFFADRLRPLLQRRGVRLAAGLIIIGFGVLGLARVTTLGHVHGAPLICYPATGG